MSLKRCLVFSAILFVVATSTSAQTPRGSITIERIAEIKFPSSPAWSPDGKRVAFLWDAAGKQDLFVVTPGKKPVQLTDFPMNPDLLVSNLGAFTWGSSDEIWFSRSGRLWTVLRESSEPAIVSGLADASDFSLSKDRKQIAFIRSGQLWLGSVEAKTQRQLTFLPEGLDASTPVFSRDGRWLAFAASRGGMEQYPLPFNGELIRSYVNAPAERKLGFVAAQGGDVAWIPTIGATSAAQFTAEGTLLYQEVSPDGKTRDIKVTSIGGVPRKIWSDRDERWFSPTRRNSKLLVSPDGESAAFISDRTGWIHVYVMPVNATSESQAQQLTSGKYLAALGSWAPGSHRIAYYHGTVGNQMERFISIIDIATGKTESLVGTRGNSFDPQFSPDGNKLLYHRTDVENSLDFYSVEAVAGAQPVRLSDSMPPGLDKADLTPPVAVKYSSRHDGKMVPATLMVHQDLDRTRKHPAIIWIHGSGSDQNYLGWHPGSYRMYYSAHQYLAQQGYIILTPDYRGSSGYSRDWATGHHMSIGVTDTADVASGALYLKELDYVDPDRIGVWGLSYGGFLTLQALWVDPTLWRAGINVAGVVDWTNRGGGMRLSGFTIPRLGTPIENPTGYDISNPVRHMQELERPLMVMHGTDDRNVAFHDSLILIDELVKLGKDFETVIYPGEIHFFRRAFVLRDAWRRAEEFFDRHLKNGPRMSSN